MLCISSANETVKPLLPMCSVEVMLNLIPLKKKKKGQGRKLFKTKMFSIKSSLKFSSTKWPLSPFILHFVPKDGKMRENNIQRCGILKLRYFKKMQQIKATLHDKQADVTDLVLNWCSFEAFVDGAKKRQDCATSNL